MQKIKRQDGFEGEKLISLPESVWLDFVQKNPAISQIYITHIGYFPHAAFHYRQRRNGCTDNIFIYCLRGKGWYEINGHKQEVEPNQFVIIPATNAALRYGADEKDPWTIHWVHFSGDNMNSFNECFNITLDTGPIDIALNKEGLEIWEQIFQSLEMGFSINNLRNANLRLPHFLATFLCPQQGPIPDSKADLSYVNKTILHMRSMLHEKLTVEEMASKHLLSASHFSTLFRKSTGMPPMDYFIHLKIQKACQLLYLENMKVKDVAQAIGYDDPYHFSRLFKKHMRVSPEQYKAMRHKEIS